MAIYELATMDKVINNIENIVTNGANTVSFKVPTSSWNCGIIFGNTNNGGNFKYDYYINEPNTIELVNTRTSSHLFIGNVSATLSGTTVTLSIDGEPVENFKTVTIIKS